MISKKYQPLAYAFFMALLMSCFMSLVISVFNEGLAENVLSIWMKAWGFAFLVAFPTVTLVSPLVSKFVAILMTRG
ncbi:MAG: DUF2798 domain-containing protein [Bermanella sp.]